MGNSQRKYFGACMTRQTYKKEKPADMAPGGNHSRVKEKRTRLRVVKTTTESQGS